jgi:hypothetical protein
MANTLHRFIGREFPLANLLEQLADGIGVQKAGFQSSVFSCQLNRLALGCMYGLGSAKPRPLPLLGMTNWKDNFHFRRTSEA